MWTEAECSATPVCRPWITASRNIAFGIAAPVPGVGIVHPLETVGIELEQADRRAGEIALVKLAAGGDREALFEHQRVRRVLVEDVHVLRQRAGRRLAHIEIDVEIGIKIGRDLAAQAVGRIGLLRDGGVGDGLGCFCGAGAASITTRSAELASADASCTLRSAMSGRKAI